MFGSKEGRVGVLKERRGEILIRYSVWLRGGKGKVKNNPLLARFKRGWKEI